MSDFLPASIPPENLALFFALGATLCFSSSSLVYTEYSKRVSVLWMNTFKSAVAFTALALTMPLFGWQSIEPLSAGGFMLSGILGLCIGDLFLLKAFTHIGPARTLILFGFQPVMTGLGAYFLLGQALDLHKLIAVFFMIACLFTFALEKYRAERRWDMSGFAFALIGVALDSCGVMLSRAAFDSTPGLAPPQGHFFRCLGALLAFGVISFFRPIHLKENFLRWPVRDRSLLVMASLGGTYLSLLLYLSAVRIGHLASIAGIGITGPMFATLLESVVHRRPPSRYLVVAFCFFAGGFYILWMAS